MKLAIASFTISFFTITSFSLPTFAIDPKTVVTEMDELLRGDSNYMLITMEVVSPQFDRSVKMESWSLGKTKSFVRILSPPKDEGMGYLKLKNNLWMYMPDVEETIKIPPSMMLEPFMGSDFTYDDIIKESSMPDDYYVDWAGSGSYSISGYDCYALELTPKPDADVVWGKMRCWVRKSDYMPIYWEYYDEDGYLVRIMEFSEFKYMGDRTIPAKWKVENREEEGHITIIYIDKAKFNISPDESIFTQQNLEDY